MEEMWRTEVPVACLGTSRTRESQGKQSGAGAGLGFGVEKLNVSASSSSKTSPKLQRANVCETSTGASLCEIIPV